MKRLFFLLTVLTLAFTAAEAKSVTVSSPDGRITLTAEGLTYTIALDGNILIKDGVAGMKVDGVWIGQKIRSSKTSSPAPEHIVAPFYRQSDFDITFNCLRTEFKDGFGIEWKVSNEGLAYRLFCTTGKPFIVDDERVEVNFASDADAWMPYSRNEKTPYDMSFESLYTEQKLSEGSPNPAFLPATVGTPCGAKVTLLESDLRAYPGLFVRASGTSLKGEFARYPATLEKYPWRDQLHITSREAFIAKADGARTFPWRVFAITTDDTQMPVNNLVYALAEPSRIEDTSWIRPGFSAWEWWNDWNLTGVDFKAGINMDTYRYYIDFASRSGLEYMILDEGWYPSASGNLFAPENGLDVKELARYAATKNVKLILWCVFNSLDEHLEEYCKYFSSIGVAGFKVDFMDRDDQTAVEMIYRIAECAAKYHLVLDYHGIWKPTGINRTFPNILNYESIHGQENVRWSTAEEADMPHFDVSFPFIRQMTGFSDYTPGAMRNAARSDFRPIFNTPMSMGTRAHQVALYIVIDSPLTMLCDSPSNYMAEAETAKFITGLPRSYSSTKILSGKIGESIVTARRAGLGWYVGGITDWNDRDITVDFSFIGDGKWTATLFSDGVNAAHNAEDYAIESFEVTSDCSRTIHLAPGGGFAMTITPHL